MAQSSLDRKVRRHAGGPLIPSPGATDVGLLEVLVEKGWPEPQSSPYLRDSAMSTETVITSVGSTGQIGWGSCVGSTKGRCQGVKKRLPGHGCELPRLSLLLA